MTKTIIIGLGNPILGNDGIGWVVAKEVERNLPKHVGHLDVEFLSLGGLALMEHLIDYDFAILIDAFKSDEVSGSVLALHLEDMPNYSAFHTTSTHDVSLQNALLVGRNLGAKLPKCVMIVGVTTEEVFEFSEELTPEVRAAVPVALRAVLDLLENPARCD
jgi:hydrogenase maturation protease